MHKKKTQACWPSQANNKLIWAISVLCGGTKQQGQTGAAASSLRWSPASPTLFSCPCGLTLLFRGRVDTRTAVSGAINSLHLWHPAHIRGRMLKQRQRKQYQKCCFATEKKVSCPCENPLMNNNSVVWHGFHGYNPHPWQTSPPTSSLFQEKKKKSCQTLCADPIMGPTGHLGGAGSFPEWNMVKLMHNLGKVYSYKAKLHRYTVCNSRLL